LRAIIVSDIHSNLEAFRSVISDAEKRGGFDTIWSLGDLVGYGPDPGACIELMREHDHLGVAGNHDLASVGKLGIESFNQHAAAASRWTTEQLTPEHVAYLSELPLRIETDGFTAVHGSPCDPVWEYVVSVAAAANFDHFETPRCLVGHSHIPFICTLGETGPSFKDYPPDEAVVLGTERRILNPGGVGQPRDGDPRSSYTIYDSDADSIAHHRVEYDIPATQEKMTERGLPRYLIDRLTYGR
jgi:diadenosine tetraphosphatase ApaH/serine/threonine PP2A family protein phosphatase